MVLVGTTAAFFGICMSSSHMCVYTQQENHRQKCRLIRLALSTPSIKGGATGMMKIPSISHSTTPVLLLQIEIFS